MIPTQRAPLRSVYNSSSINETTTHSNNTGDIHSYIGKFLTINVRQVLVEDILGQGGFAFVFLVRSSNQQRYALKRMYVNNQRDLQICQREISLVKEFSNHPNIIKYIDSSIQQIFKRSYSISSNNYDEDDTIHEILFLTEYCSNGALINRLNEQQQLGIHLNERQILRIFADICNAVSACHFRRPQPILHRDIKLENILLDSQNNSILCDFGSAILLSPSNTFPNQFQQYQTNQLTTNLIQQIEEDIQRYTTLAYRAPEMIDLYSRLPITLKVDIWAMGCLLYRLMYKKLPFGDSILAIQNGTFVIPDDMSNVYSSELNILVRYLLEIDIDKRPDIWQVSYLTYKLLGIDCPIPNRCQSKIPDLKNISMPLTDSEFRHQRSTTLSKAKSTSANIIDDSSSHGTAVNPRERPRGMIAPSTSLINFNQPSQQQQHRSTTLTAPQPPPTSSASQNSSRSGSSAQLMFDDDFSQMPSSHAISLTNIPIGSTTTTATNKTDQIPVRARPSPPTSLSAASGLAFQQQFFPPPPPSSSSSSSNVQSHRRSASQTIPMTNNPSSFLNASSGDTSIHHQKEIFHDELNHTKKSYVHHPMTEEAKDILSSSIDELSTTDCNENSDDEQQINPFLHAPFHHSHTIIKSQTFDPNSIIIGKRTSAFVPYQKQDNLPMNSDVFINAPFKIKPKSKQQQQQQNSNMESSNHRNHSTIDEFF